MSDVVKAVLGGAWTLVVGWLFPMAVSLFLFAVLVLPSLQDFAFARTVLTATVATRSLTLLVAAVLGGLILSALQTPLYRILEGYLLWPAGLRKRRTATHLARRTQLQREAQEATGIEAALKRERVRRYPTDKRQIAPTLLGNAVRRFETYGFDRYRLDSQLLWSQLRAVAPELAVKQVDQARAGVDFFICLIYSQLAVSVTALAALVAGRPYGLRLGLTAIGSVMVAYLCYRLAIVASDSWCASVQCLVDTGRAPLAKVFGLVSPKEFEQEREMWRGVNWLVRRPYEPELATYLNQWRAEAGTANDSDTSPGRCRVPGPEVTARNRSELSS
jgi:hypothetical protein